MAYMSQERKKEIAKNVKQLLKNTALADVTLLLGFVTTAHLLLTFSAVHWTS